MSDTVSYKKDNLDDLNEVGSAEENTTIDCNDAFANDIFDIQLMGVDNLDYDDPDFEAKLAPMLENPAKSAKQLLCKLMTWRMITDEALFVEGNSMPDERLLVSLVEDLYVYLNQEPEIH